MKRPKTVWLTAYPRRFYTESGTRMGTLADESGERWDWGFVEIALEKGTPIIIEPANQKQLERAEIVLAKIKQSQAQNEKT